VIGSVTMSFPVFWEYSFKAALKIAWNCEDDVFKREFEDIVLDKMDSVEGRDQNVLGGGYICALGLYCTCLHCPKCSTGNQGNRSLYQIRKTDARYCNIGYSQPFYILF
jgi:hypothetical protein